MPNIAHRHPSLRAGIFLLFIALAALLNPLPSPAAEQQLQLRNFVLDNSDGQIAVRFGIGFTDLDPVRLMLKEGAQLTLECEARLSAPGTLWFSEILTHHKFTSVLTYNVLTREYIIVHGNETTLHKSTSLLKLLEGTWEELSITLGQLSALERGEDYRVTLDVRVKNDNVPPWMAKTLFFWSWDVAPSMHYTMNFTF
ncbi:MAG: DUF4390 domain-containing protein [Halodesulfovibrio sp.]